MSNIIDTIRVSGTDYVLSATSSGGADVVEITQNDYDNLPESAKTEDILYVISDAEAGDLSQYWTSAQTNSAITQAVSGKQDTLVSGTNIKTINNESLLGSGNINIQGGGGISSAECQSMIDESISGKTDETTFTAYTSATDTALAGKQTTLTAGTGIDITDNVISTTGGGGKAIKAGTNISVTTGETADTISCTLPLAVGSGSRSLKNVANSIADSIGEASFAMGRGSVRSKGDSSFAFGTNVTINGYGSFGAGVNVNTYSSYETVFGLLNNVSGLTEFACGQNCLSRVVDGSFDGYGNSGNTQFIVGNGKQNVAQHNAFEVRQNGDIYIVDTNDTSTSNYWEKPMIKLQDTIAATAANTTALGGLKLVKLTQAEYDALTNYDSNTLYVIVN